jgi:hypothetical protein
MFNEDGGPGTVTGSTTRPGRGRWRLTACLRSATFFAGVAGRMLFFTVARALPLFSVARALAVDAGRVMSFLPAGRLPNRRAGARLRAALRDRACFPAFRLAMFLSFQNLDSLAISVVLSYAYR